MTPARYRALLALVLVVTAVFGGLSLSVSPPKVDGLRYLSTAHNVATQGVYSYRMPQESEPTPDNRLEPLYSWTLIPGVFIADRLSGEDLSCFLESGDGCANWHRLMKLPNLIMLLGLVSATTWTASRLLQNQSLALISAATVGLLYLFPSYVDHYFAEILSALLVTLHAGLLLRSAQNRRWPPGSAVLIGGTAGLMALTNSVFLYWIPVLVVLVYIAVRRQRQTEGRSQAAVVAILALVTALAITSPWLIRNTTNVPDASMWQVSGGGGGVLSMRVQLGTMTAKEYGAAWVYWSTPTYGPRLAERLLEEDAYARLDRSHPDGFYQTNRRGEGLAPRGDTAAGIRLYLENPVKQALLTPLMAFRGTVPWAQFSFIDQPTWMSYLRLLQESLYRLMTPALILMIWIAARRKAIDALLLWSPLVFSIGMHAFLTHYLPRYSVPIAALGTVAIVGAVGHLTSGRFAARQTTDGRQ